MQVSVELHASRPRSLSVPSGYALLLSRACVSCFPIAWWSLGILGLGILLFFSNLMMIGAGLKAAERLTYRLRHMTFAAMLRQEMGWFDQAEVS